MVGRFPLRIDRTCTSQPGISKKRVELTVIAEQKVFTVVAVYNINAVVVVIVIAIIVVVIVIAAIVIAVILCCYC